MTDRDFIPVAPSWERNPEDSDIWRRVVVMPSLALNRAELEFLGPVAGKRVAVLDSGEGLVPLALASMGAKVTVIDSSSSGLDMVMVRAQIVGVEVDFREAEFTNLKVLGRDFFEILYMAQITGGIEDLGRFYSEVYQIIVPGGRVVLNEYHPFRKIWKQEPGQPRIARSYFERRGQEVDDEYEDGMKMGLGFAGGSRLVSSKFEYRWTVADHFYFLTGAGFQVIGMEEVGDARQAWELPNLRGLPEQLIIAAEKPQERQPAV